MLKFGWVIVVSTRGFVAVCVNGGCSRLLAMTTLHVTNDLRWMSIDPGGTTGWAQWIGDEFQASGEVKCGRNLGDQGWGVDELVGMVRSSGVRFLLFEDFLLRGSVGTTDRVGIAPPHVTSRLIGRLEGLDYQFDYDLQSATMMPVMSNIRLKRKGLYVKGEHARDAVRHGLIYQRRSRQDHGQAEG